MKKLTALTLIMVIVMLLVVPSMLFAQGGIRIDPDQSLSKHDRISSFLTPTSFPDLEKNAILLDRVVRVDADGNTIRNATTDVWEHKGFAYIGTFNTPCGDGTGANGSGIVIHDVKNANDIREVGRIPSVTGSRINDIKAASTAFGDILVYTNELCSTKGEEQGDVSNGAPAGSGGIEIWNVDNPLNPIHLASVRISELNSIVPTFFKAELQDLFNDLGVHNTFIFDQDGKTYVAVVAEGLFDNFRIYLLEDLITNVGPDRLKIDPTPVASWGAEELRDPGVGDLTAPPDERDLSKKDPDKNAERVRLAIRYLLCADPDNLCPAETERAAANRFLHDTTVYDNGTRALLANWDAGLVLLNIDGLSNPNFSFTVSSVISVALDTSGTLDGNVNSHHAWPFTYLDVNGLPVLGVVETNEDFGAWERQNIPLVPTFEALKRREIAFLSKVFAGGLTAEAFSPIEQSFFKEFSLFGTAANISGGLTETTFSLDATTLAGDEASLRQFSDIASMLNAAELTQSTFLSTESLANLSVFGLQQYNSFLLLVENIALANGFEALSSEFTAFEVALKAAGFATDSDLAFRANLTLLASSLEGISAGRKILDAAAASDPLFADFLLDADADAVIAGFDSVKGTLSVIASSDDANALAFMQQVIDDAEVAGLTGLAAELRTATSLAEFSFFLAELARAAGFQLAICGSAFSFDLDIANALGTGIVVACTFVLEESDSDVAVTIAEALATATDASCVEDLSTGVTTCKTLAATVFFLSAEAGADACTFRKLDDTLEAAIIGAAEAFAAGTGPAVVLMVDVGLPCDPIDMAEIAAGLGANAVIFSGIFAPEKETVWGNVRIWDYSDPANPALASTLYSRCGELAHFKDIGTPGVIDSGEELGCDPSGAYSAHNVMVRGTTAFLSWYRDGIVIVDVSDPYNPNTTGQLRLECPDGSPTDVWGVFKPSGAGSPVFMSDRNCGLGVVKTLGGGTNP